MCRQEEPSTMVKRPGDETPGPPGGRAAARRAMFEEARGPGGKPVAAPPAKAKDPARTGGKKDAKPKRRGD
jgi:hypothetical protein